VIDLRADFRERVEEVEAYLELVSGIEQSVQHGIPLLRVPTGSTTVVRPLQQKLLYAGVYLHLYNLVEATVSRCIAAVEEAASMGNRQAGDLSLELRSEWVRSVARTHEFLNNENKLKSALKLCDHLVAMLPVKMTIDQGVGGNWDDEEIYRFAERLGVQLRLTTQADVKRPFRDGRGAMQVIKYLRNKLAHGEISFAECGDGLSAGQLEDLKKRTVAYLEEVIGCFEGFITRHEFLQPAKRPAAGGG
jgi:hypothetical protein